MLIKSFGRGWHVIGSWRNKFIGGNGNKQAFLQRNNNVEIVENQTFYIGGAPDKEKNNVSDSLLKHCHFSGVITLTDNDRKQLNQKYPNYCFNHVSKFEAVSNTPNRVVWGKKRFKTFSIRKNQDKK